MIFRFPHSRLVHHVAGRREGFAAAVEAVAQRDGDDIIIDSVEWSRLAMEYANPQKAGRGLGDCSDPQTARSPALESSLTRPPKPPEPTAAELTTSLGYAAFRAARAAILGERVVLTDPEFRARAAACAGCEFWDAAARGGLGKCRVCGCTQLKLWLATERCPKGRWPALSSAPTAPRALQDPTPSAAPNKVMPRL